MSKRGRPIVDTEWNAILSRSAEIVPHEDDDNEARVEQWRLTGELPHGCKLRPGQAEKSLEKVWLCSMYLGKKQRIIGTGTLHQCARLYDAAIFRFAQYRLHPGNDLYNFSLQQAKADNYFESEISGYFDGMEALLLARGELTSSADRKNVRQLNVAEERHGRTAMGRLENTQRIMIDQIEALKVGLQTVTDLVKQSALTLSVLNSKISSVPGEKITKILEPVVPAIPQMPSAPILSCFNPPTTKK